MQINWFFGYCLSRYMISFPHYSISRWFPKAPKPHSYPWFGFHRENLSTPRVTEARRWLRNPADGLHLMSATHSFLRIVTCVIVILQNFTNLLFREILTSDNTIKTTKKWLVPLLEYESTETDINRKEQIEAFKSLYFFLKLGNSNKCSF